MHEYKFYVVSDVDILRVWMLCEIGVLEFMMGLGTNQLELVIYTWVVA